MTVPEWFPGEGRNADDEAFLAQLRHLAASRGLTDVRPEGTGTSIYADTADVWVVAWLGIPGLDAGDADPQLQVGFDLSDPGIEPLVATWETHGFLLDNWEVLAGPDHVLDPAGAAAQAFEWLGHQLRRPVERRTWQLRRLWRRTTYTAWHHADTGQLLCERPWRLHPPTSAPDEVVRLR